jgi:urease subunit alpha
MSPLSPSERLARYGPTVDDRIRLGDTDLWIRVGEDRQAGGDEPIWGYAKTIRPRAMQGRAMDSELDVVVAGAVVLDPVLGAMKADIGIKDGRIVGVGRAGSDTLTEGIDLRIGPHTQPIMGYGLIATPGAVDSHVHLISPELLPAALSGGVTTLITAGFEEPPWSMARTLAGVSDWPINIGLQACARAEDDPPLVALLDAGACGFKIHEDYGAYPELIDHVLRFADGYDVSVSLHTDGLHESAELEDTVAAIGGRTVHAYHVEGSGGGHVPDVIGLVRESNVICSSTTPTVPFGVNTAVEQAPMIVLNHGASFGVEEDMALVRDRVHPATMAAEGPLHELGAIAIVNSDSQGMGRIMETVRRTFQLADVMSGWDGTETVDPFNTTERVLRYLAKVTIEPAITHGIADQVGSLRLGRLADIVLWEPAYFGVKPALVLKGGMAAWAALGDGNASVERAEPTRYRADWGGRPRAAGSLSATFVSSASTGSPELRRLGREVIAVSGTRGLSRESLVRNRAIAAIEVDVTDGSVTLDGRPLAMEPVAEVPLSRAYLLR